MKAAVIGAGGGIGAALVAALAADERYERVHAFSRDGTGEAHPAIVRGVLDIGDPPSIAAAAETVTAPLDLLIVATGLLHEGAHGPERALRELDADWMARNFAINTIGPSLVLRHFTPLLPRTGRSAVAMLSARVGSISDNRAGGWYGYRASKAALNMIVRTAAIELARNRPDAVCVTLHPGTVDTGLSLPFQKGVAAGKLFTPAYSAARLLTVIDGLTAAESGRCFAWDGSEIIP